MIDEYISVAHGVTFSAPRIPVASTLLGSVVEAPGTFNGRYLRLQTQQPVEFVSALNSIDAKLHGPLWIELEPSAVCSSFVSATLYSLTPTKGIM